MSNFSRVIDGSFHWLECNLDVNPTKFYSKLTHFTLSKYVAWVTLHDSKNKKIYEKSFKFKSKGIGNVLKKKHGLIIK